MSRGYGKKVDANQPLIVEELRKCGFTVRSTAAVGNGFPDIVVGFVGLTFQYELKVDDKQKLTDEEKKFSMEWEGHQSLAVNTEQVIGEIRSVLNDFFESKWKHESLKELHKREKKLFMNRKREKAKKK